MTTQHYDPSIAIRRRLSAVADRHGRITMLAIDHRQNLRRALGADATSEQLIAFKLEVIGALGEHASSILTDPEYGAPQAIAADLLGGARGLVLAIEATGYVADGHNRVSRILDGWGVEQSQRLGADAVKLLVYYHPDAENAGAQEELVAEVVDTCRGRELALFIEPLSYGLDGGPVADDEFADVVVATADRLTSIGGDVLKAEFPSRNPDPDSWIEPLQRLDQASKTPWVILSGGVSFELFRHQAEVAATHGCCGVMAGRAIWNEAVTLEGTERQEFLGGTARHRLDQLTAIEGPGWFDRATPIPPPSPTWYRGY